MEVKELGHIVLYVRDLEVSRGFYAAPIPAGRRAGMYHFGLKVGTTDEELREALETLVNAGADVRGSADHTVTHSLYIADPDGNEIELYIDVQPEIWRDDPQAVMAPTRPLRL